MIPLTLFSGNPGKQRFEKAVSGMYLGDILKTAFPLEEFEEKFDAQKLTSIMNYPDIYKDVYVQVAQWIYGRSAQIGCRLTYGAYHVTEIL